MLLVMNFPYSFLSARLVKINYVQCDLALFDAMSHGQVETVKYFLDHGFHVNGT